jgi:hypothetical protein
MLGVHVHLLYCRKENIKVAFDGKPEAKYVAKGSPKEPKEIS